MKRGAFRIRGERFELRLDVRERKPALAQVADLSTGRLWGPVPVVALEVHDKAVRREDRICDPETVVADRSADMARLMFRDPYRGIVAAMWLRMTGTELSVLVSPAEIYESKPDRFRLFSIEPLPGLARVSGGNARLLLPVSGGTVCRPLGKPRTSDRFMLYLEQPRWELATIVPVAAAWDRGGLLWLASKGAAETECRVATDGAGSGTIGMAFSWRRHWPDPVAFEERELRIASVPRGVDPIMHVAMRLRDHIRNDLGKPPISDRMAESREAAYVASALTVKLFHGMQREGACITDFSTLSPTEFINVMTFAEAEDCLRFLKRLGIERIYTQSVGWNSRGHDGLYPTRFPIERRLGGEEGFRRLIETAKRLGYMPSVHDNFQMNVPHAPDWSEECVIRDVYGEPLVRGWWAGGTEYGSWPSAFPHSRLRGHLERMKALGIEGMYYCDYWMPPLEVNYHPTHRGTRSDHLRGILNVLEEARRIFGAVGVEFGTVAGVAACESVAMGFPPNYLRSCRAREEWPVSHLLDELTPLYPAAVHGFVLHQAAGGPTWQNAIRAVVWGGVPRDEFGIRHIDMGGIARFSPERARGLKALYDLCIGRFGHLIWTPIESCRMEQDGLLARCVYADGTVVEADHTAGTLAVNGGTLRRPDELALTRPSGGRKGEKR